MGWHVLVDGDQPVMRIAVSSATAAKSGITTATWTMCLSISSKRWPDSRGRSWRFGPTDGDVGMGADAAKANG